MTIFGHIANYSPAEELKYMVKIYLTCRDIGSILLLLTRIIDVNGDDSALQLPSLTFPAVFYIYQLVEHTDDCL